MSRHLSLSIAEWQRPLPPEEVSGSQRSKSLCPGDGNYDHASSMVTGSQTPTSVCKVWAARKDDLGPVPGI